MTNFTENEMKILNILADNHGAKWDTEEDDNSPHIDTFELTTDGSGERLWPVKPSHKTQKHRWTRGPSRRPCHATSAE